MERVVTFMEDYDYFEVLELKILSLGAQDNKRETSLSPYICNALKLARNGELLGIKWEKHVAVDKVFLQIAICFLRDQ